MRSFAASTTCCSLLLVASVLSPLRAEADEMTQRAKQLAELRTEVEALSGSLELEQEALRADLRSLQLQQAELEGRVRQEEVRLAELERLLAERKEALESDTLADTHLRPMLEDAMRTVEASIRGSLPYRTDERLQAVDTLRQGLNDGTLPPRAAVAKLWQVVEDEIRLTQENVLDRQVVEMGGERHLAKVARVGMVALYVRTEDDRFASAVRDGSGWTYEPITGDGVVQVASLFESLRGQIRVGWFDLPLVLPEVTR